MIVFTVSFTPSDGVGIGDRFFASLTAARLFTIAIIAGENDEAVITSSVTATKLRGADLFFAALNRRGWVLPGSLREVERWRRVEGRPRKMIRRLAPSPGMRDSKEELP